MTIEADLVSILRGSSSVAAYSSNRVYLEQLPQNVTYPAISYLLVSSVRTPLMGNDAVNVQSRFQFDCWAATPSSANALSDALLRAIERYGPSSTGTMDIETIFIEDVQTITEEDPDEKVFRRSIDAVVCYRTS